MFDNEALNKI